MKVLIAVPALDFCATDFAMSLASLMATKQKDALGRDIKLALSCCKGSLIMHARNKLLQEAVDAAASHILFLDSDMVFPPDTLSRLARHGVPIVGADYVNRVAPHPLNGTPNLSPGKMTMTDKRGVPTLVPMLTLPFGCILISLKVLDGMPRPWFKYLEGEDDRRTQSEDTYFCNAARRLGHTIWCDPSLTREVGHIGTHIFRPGANLP